MNEVSDTEGWEDLQKSSDLMRELWLESTGIAARKRRRANDSDDANDDEDDNKTISDLRREAIELGMEHDGDRLDLSRRIQKGLK